MPLAACAKNYGTIPVPVSLNTTPPPDAPPHIPSGEEGHPGPAADALFCEGNGGRLGALGRLAPLSASEEGRPGPDAGALGRAGSRATDRAAERLAMLLSSTSIHTEYQRLGHTLGWRFLTCPEENIGTASVALVSGWREFPSV